MQRERLTERLARERSSAGKKEALFNGQSTCVKDLKDSVSISLKEVKRLVTGFNNIPLMIVDAE